MGLFNSSKPNLCCMLCFTALLVWISYIIAKDFGTITTETAILLTEMVIFLTEILIILTKIAKILTEIILLNNPLSKLALESLIMIVSN